MTQATRFIAGVAAGVFVCAVVGFLSAIPYVAAISYPDFPSLAEAASGVAFVGSIVAAVAASAGLVLFIVFGIPLHWVFVRLGRARMASYALGAGETSLLKMTTAYAIMANGGKQVNATLIDRIQDRFGKTVFRHDNRDCTACNVETYSPGLAEPNLPDAREQVMNPYTAYQITSMMEGVVQRGTGKSLQKVGKPVAGKTGTSNLEKDAWFIGFTPDLVVGVYVGFDTPKPMGDKRTGGGLAAPIVTDFMQVALRDKAAIPFRVPRESRPRCSAICALRGAGRSPPAHRCHCARHCP